MCSLHTIIWHAVAPNKIIILTFIFKIIAISLLRQMISLLQSGANSSEWMWVCITLLGAQRVKKKPEKSILSDHLLVWVTGKERQKETVPFFSRHPVHLSRSYFWPTQVKMLTFHITASSILLINTNKYAFWQKCNTIRSINQVYLYSK